MYYWLFCLYNICIDFFILKYFIQSNTSKCINNSIVSKLFSSLNACSSTGSFRFVISFLTVLNMRRRAALLVPKEVYYYTQGTQNSRDSDWTPEPQLFWPQTEPQIICWNKEPRNRRPQIISSKNRTPSFGNPSLEQYGCIWLFIFSDSRMSSPNLFYFSKNQT